MKRRPLLVANWKAHGSKDFVDDYCARLELPTNADVVICPPWAYLARVAAALSHRGVHFGVQSTGIEPEGAFTGEHAAEMARDLGAEFAIVGHSERRRLFGEADAVVVARKFQAAQRASLTPILCVGEAHEARLRGEAEAVVRAQLEVVEALCGWSALDGAVIAYEPVWAIGTGQTATPEQAQEMHQLIRSCLPVAASAVRVLYGGSVNPDNAAEILAQDDVDGALVGGASLDAGAFSAICFGAP